MAYNTIKENLLPSKYYSSEKLQNVNAIAVHWTAGAGGDAESLYNWYVYGNHNYEVNCHYAIGLSGQVIQYVPEQNVSWCTNSANNETISIEVCNADKDNKSGTWTDATYDSLIQLVVELLKKYNLPAQAGEYSNKRVTKKGIIRHYDVTKKNCPLRFVPINAPTPGVDDVNNSNYKQFIKDVQKRMGTSGSTTTTSQKNYLYHPLGEYGEKLASGTAPIDAYAHTYGSHGWSKCDWNPGGGLGIYSMTDGTITAIAQRNDRYSGENRKGYWVFVKPSNINYSGDCYIRYMEMGGLADDLCDAVQQIKVPKGKATYSAANGEWTQNCSIPIQKGKLLGYTNTFTGQSDVHIDFMKNPFNPDDSSAISVPNIQGMTLAEGFEIKDNKIYKDGQILGTKNGNVPLLGGGESNYTVYPIYSYCIQLQKPTYIEAGSGGSGDLTNLTQKYTNTGNAPTPDYGTKSFSNKFMGTYPRTLEQLNSQECNGLRILAQAAKGEMGRNQYGLTYGKLFRTWIMYSLERHNGKYANQTTSLLDFANFWNKARQDWGMSAISPVQLDSGWLNFSQNLYSNIQNPNAYGITDQDALYAAFSGPCQNQWSSSHRPITSYGPFVWIVCKRKPDGGLNGNETVGNGCLLLYRTKSYSLGSVNKNI